MVDLFFPPQMQVRLQIGGQLGSSSLSCLWGFLPSMPSTHRYMHNFSQIFLYLFHVLFVEMVDLKLKLETTLINRMFFFYHRSLSFSELHELTSKCQVEILTLLVYVFADRNYVD